MEVDINTGYDTIEIFPATELEEIIQNVRTIIATPKLTVPLDREFGISGKIIDQPIGTAQARLTAAIVAAVAKYEPRAKVKNVLFNDAREDGVLNATIRLSVDETKLRGGVL